MKRERNPAQLRVRSLLSPIATWLCAGWLFGLSFGMQGCSHSDGPYSDEQVARMKAEADGIKDPSKLPPDIAQKREEANARLRANRTAPPTAKPKAP